MSRWFKILFVLMVLFVIRLGIKAHLNKPPKFEEAIMAEEIYQAYQDDPTAASELYGGERVTIEGEICDIVDHADGFTIILGRGPYSGNPAWMVECVPTELRHYPRSRFEIGRFASVYGVISKEYTGLCVRIERCQIIMA